MADRPIIDEELSRLISPLSGEEREGLEALLVAEGCQEPLALWRGVLLDGHHRLEICERLGIQYTTREIDCGDRAGAIEWMVRNQLGRRNLSSYQRVRLALRLEQVYAAKAKARQAHGLTAPGKPLVRDGDEKRVDVNEEIARAAGVSRDTAARVRTIEERADKKEKAALESGEKSINQVYEGMREAERRAELDARRAESKARLAKIAARDPGSIEGTYDTIVIDPPWPMRKIERKVRPRQTGFDYPTMTEEELAALAIPASEDCHVFVWTTQKFLPMAFRLLAAWGLDYRFTMVWHKPGGFQPFGLPQFNCEFVVCASRGRPTFQDAAFAVCFSAGRGAHSEKPEAFYAILRRATDGRRRLDMFNRRQIAGFDGWGNES